MTDGSFSVDFQTLSGASTHSEDRLDNSDEGPKPTFARRFAGGGEGGWAAYSVVTAVVFLLSFVGIATGSGNGWTILGFWIGVVLAWSWITAMALRLIGAQERPA